MRILYRKIETKNPDFHILRKIRVKLLIKKEMYYFFGIKSSSLLYDVTR